MLQGVWNINFFCQSLKITSDILRYITYSALKCHLAAAFCFIINVAWFIFSDLSSDAWAFSCVYTKRYIIYGQSWQSQEFQQNNLLKSCIGSLVKSQNCNRTASPPDLAHCGGGGMARPIVGFVGIWGGRACQLFVCSMLIITSRGYMERLPPCSPSIPKKLQSCDYTMWILCHWFRILIWSVPILSSTADAE